MSNIILGPPKLKKAIFSMFAISISITMTIAALDFLGQVLIKYNKKNVQGFIHKNTWYLPSSSNQGLLRYRFRPYFRGREWGTDFSINSFGLRGADFSFVKSDNTIRILALGDSCTFGVGGLSDQETYPAILEQLLNESKYRKKFEVINAGMPGFSVYEGFIFLAKSKLMGIKPDLTIICYGWNDHQRVKTSDKIVAYKNWINNFLKEYLLIWRFLSSKWGGASQPI